MTHAGHRAYKKVDQRNRLVILGQFVLLADKGKNALSFVLIVTNKLRHPFFEGQ